MRLTASTLTFSFQVAVIGWHVFEHRSLVQTIPFPTDELPNAAKESVDVVEGRNPSVYSASYSAKEDKYHKHVNEYDDLEKKKKAADGGGGGGGFEFSFPFNSFWTTFLILLGLFFDVVDVIVFFVNARNGRA